MTTTAQSLAIGLFSEVFASDQLLRNQLSRIMPRGMELSHFSVLNHLARYEGERSPAELARIFGVTRGAMTNTLSKLEASGHIHIRPDWEDARRKMVAISPSGKSALDAAISAITPIMQRVVEDLGEEKVRAAIPILRELREELVRE